MAYKNDICAYPCDRYVQAAVSSDGDFVQCGNCGMWFPDWENNDDGSNAPDLPS
jgi:hypothetical protein